jgi:CubicO group peptidase (beta-lactamase class C family)
VSGGQTGVDRAALDVALALGIPYGGWCPAGGWAEDLPDPPGVLASYSELRETPSRQPRQRTRWNVRDSEATLVLTAGAARSTGTDLARLVASELGRPLGVVDVLQSQTAFQRAAELLATLPPDGSLCVAGPRESEAPGIYERAKRLLEGLLA